jgi:hypothetical protein
MIPVDKGASRGEDDVMRTPDHDELPGDGDSSHRIGEGFGGVDPNHIETYGDDFYDDYSDTYDSDETSDSDTGFGDGDDTSDDGFDTDDLPSDGTMTEDEAEDILEDVLEDAYGEDAGEIAQELEEDTGMSALEILEDLTGLDLDGSDDASYASADFDRQMLEAAQADASIDATTTSDLFNEDMPAESDFDINLDGHVDRHDLHDAAHDMGFHVGE